MRAQLICLFLLSTVATESAAHAEGVITERRIWLEESLTRIEAGMCADNMKQWRCIFTDKDNCKAAMKFGGDKCHNDLVPNLPEYIDGPEIEAQAQKVVTDCIGAVLVKQYVVTLPKDKMADYNVCTGLVPRTKPLSPNLQKAEDLAKAQLANYICDPAGTLRKCYALSANSCAEIYNNHLTACTLKIESDGIKVHDGEAQDIGHQISECTIAESRKDADAHFKKANIPECK